MLRILQFITVMLSLAFSGVPTPSYAAEKLSVMLEWFVNPDHAPLIVAKEMGYFEDMELDVELIPPADPSSVPRLIAAGQADVGIHYQPSLYLDHEAGLPIVRFGTLIETPLNVLTVLENSPIKSLSNLKGKKIGFSVSGFEEALLGKMLASVGLNKDDVTLINVNFALSQSLLAEQVDATIGGFRNFELTQIELEGGKAKAFYPEDFGVPLYDELVFIALPSRLSEPRFKAFLAAVEKGANYLTNKPEASWQLYTKAFPNLDDELNKRAFADTLPRFAKRPAALDKTRYKRFADFMLESGLVKTAPKVSDIAVELD